MFWYCSTLDSETGLEQNRSMFNYTQYLIGMHQAHNALSAIGSCCGLREHFKGESFAQNIAAELKQFDTALVHAFQVA